MRRRSLYIDAAEKVEGVVDTLASADERDASLLVSMADLAARLRALADADGAEERDVEEIQSLMVEVADLVLALESVRLSDGVSDAERALMLSLLYVLQDCVHRIADDEVWNKEA